MKKILKTLSVLSLLLFFILHSCSKSSPYEIRPSGIITNPPISPGLPPSPPPSNCSFWMKDPYAMGDIYLQVTTPILTLTIGGETKTLSYYYNESGPAGCGLTGTLNFNLPEGLHTWTATTINRSRSASGTILITTGGCTVKEIVF